MLEISEVSKSFPGQKNVLDTVSLTIQKNEFFCILGPSGCGKSTLLRLISGLERASSGRITIDGTNLDDFSPGHRPSRLVFQRLGLFPHLNVFENIAFGPSVSGVGKEKTKQDVTEMLAMVHLSGFEKRRITELSGGQMQRVALARALIGKPMFLLLDESLSALDPGLRKKMQIELKELQRKSGTTFVLVTHDPSEAFFLAHRLAIINRGRLEQVGTPEQIYLNPKTEFVFHFVGDGNRLDAQMIDRPNSAFVRPENIDIEKPQMNDLAGFIQFNGRYEGCSFLGQHYEYYFRLKDKLLKVAKSKNYTLTENKEYPLYIAKSSLIFLESETENHG